MKLRPLGNRVLLKKLEAQTKTKSGLYIPESAKEAPIHAQVVAVGDGELVKTLKVGDRVVYESYGGKEIKVDGAEFLIMDVKDILAKVE